MARIKKEANSSAATTPRRTKSQPDQSDDEMPKAKAATRGKADGGRSKKAKKDPNAPKRGLSAYMFYANANREKVREADPEITFGQVGKKLGEQWKALDAEEKKKYEDMATKDKKRYEDEKKKYNASAGDEDDEEGSE